MGNSIRKQFLQNEKYCVFYTMLIMKKIHFKIDNTVKLDSRPQRLFFLP